LRKSKVVDVDKYYKEKNEGVKLDKRNLYSEKNVVTTKPKVVKKVLVY